MLISATRLRLRSVRFLIPFALATWRSARQAVHAPGFLGGQLLMDAGGVFWTLTAWESEAHMRAYRQAGAHRQAMQAIGRWCCEAAAVHWEQPPGPLPEWTEVHRRMAAHGVFTPLRHPSPAHTARQIRPPAGRRSLTLRPAGTPPPPRRP